MQLVNQKQLTDLSIGSIGPVFELQQLEAPCQPTVAPKSLSAAKVAMSLAIVAAPFVAGVMSVDLLSAADPAIVYWMVGVAPYVGLTFSLASLIAIWTWRKRFTSSAAIYVGAAPMMAAMIGFFCGLASLP